MAFPSPQDPRAVEAQDQNLGAGAAKAEALRRIDALERQLAAMAWRAGDLKPSGIATVPAGWLACDGSAVSRTTYAALFAAIATAYGPGNGSTTFNVPDLRGRMPMGSGTGLGAGTAGASGTSPAGGALTARVAGAWGGVETHTLTAAESGVNGSGSTGGESGHTHALSGAGGYWQIASFGAAAGGSTIFPNTGPQVTVTGASSGHTHGLTARGADSAHNNMSPFTVVTWLVKT